MPVVPAVSATPRRLLAGLISIVVFALAIDRAVALPLADEVGSSAAPLVEVTGNLLVSEVMTGGASASDEFIELYNPTTEDLPLDGLEVVYVTASGATVTRKAAWEAGAAGIPSGGHVLIANGAGIFAALADVAYANGLAATGGSVALRVIGAATPVDAVAWGNATSTWLEARPAAAPAAGSSLERLPGGSAGSTQDTDDNLIDFYVRPAPDPQNSSSPPIAVGSGSPAPSASPTPSATATETPQPSGSPTLTPTLAPSPTGTPSPTPSPTPSATPMPTVTATASPSATPSSTPAPLSIADARSRPDDTTVTVEGVALTRGDFSEGGGYLADATAGIAVLVSDGSFERGALLRITGTVDDRYAQRTVRATASSIAILGSGSEPLPLDATTGAIGEAFEGQLVEVTGVISSSATALSTGVAWDLDDGSGAIRVLVNNGLGIDTSSWARGVGLTLVGVVGQRDSSGTGASGYRIQPRDSSDIVAVIPVASPSPSPSPQPIVSPQPTGSPLGSGSASPSSSPTAPLVSISEARSAATNTRLHVRGVVTAPSGLIEAASAIVQDASAAILVRIGTDVGSLALGQLVELDGTRATKAGMLSLRVSTAPSYLGQQPDPDPLRRATGALGEADEARLVIVRGAISGPISRPRGGSVSFAVDDGSGQIRVTISSRSQIPTAGLAAGGWLELRAVLAQETTGSAPTSGYRLWPRIPADLRVIAAAVMGSTGSGTCCDGGTAPNLPDNLPDALQDQVQTPATQRNAPILARPQPTTSPRQISTDAADTSDEPVGAAGGGLVVSGMGLAALAGLGVWATRRRLPDDDPTAEADAPEAPEVAETPAMAVIPRLSVLRTEPSDTREERRILPPT